MGIKPRSSDQTAVSFSLPKALLDQADARAAALGMSRSQYLNQLLRRDVTDRAPLILQETPPEYRTKNVDAIASEVLKKYQPPKSLKPERGA